VRCGQDGLKPLGVKIARCEALYLLVVFSLSLWYSCLRRLKPMSLTPQQKQLAETIEHFVQTIESQGGGDEEIVTQAFDYMATCKKLLDTTTHEQMDQLCETYPGLYRFAKLMEHIAQGIQDGTIRVPKVH
jgi:hypothetical protein